jgi:hypothetical protein
MPFVIEETVHGPIKRTLNELTNYLHDSAPPRWVEEYHQARTFMTQAEAWGWVKRRAEK